MTQEDKQRDTEFMRQALLLADQAAELGEVPVGALLVSNNTIVARGYNQPIINHDPSAHAEIVCLRAAGQALNNYRFPGTTLYVTLEPCTMCVGAIIHARVSRLVFGALEPRAGAVESQQSMLTQDFFNHRIEWKGGVLAEHCGERLSVFFRDRR